MLSFKVEEELEILGGSNTRGDKNWMKMCQQIY